MVAKILILGAKGLLGQELVKAFSEQNPIAWDKEDLDLTDFVAVEKALNDLKPEVIINATGYTNVDLAETDFENAKAINGEAVGELARQAQKLGAILVHFSTEYVFDGEKTSGYDEDALPNPLNAYGRSKLLGEQLLMANCKRYYLIRLSWLFGAGGPNFIDNMLKLARERTDLKIVSDQISKLTYSVDLVQAVARLLSEQPAFGIYHLVNEGQTSKYDLICEAVKLIGLEIKITPCASSEFPTPARRPLQAYLNNNKWTKLRPWQEALAEYLKNK